jgi:hypothetical protein
MVMVIDRERDGKLTPCTRAYDTAVAGIISGAKGLQPGMVMKAEGQPCRGRASRGHDRPRLVSGGRCARTHPPR